MSVQTLGLRAFREAIQASMDLARRAEAHIRASRELELLGPATLGIVCFRFNPPEREINPGDLEALNHSIQDEIVGSGLAMMSSTRLRGAFSLRLAIMNYRSTWEDVSTTLQAVQAAGTRLLGGERP
jgi:aromatic-L-amino-acid decarboxylase